jgi:kynurenine formamidase
VYDLTHFVETGMPTYPGDPSVAVTPHATHATDGYRVSAVSVGSHTGTHVDAPAHTDPDGRTLDSYLSSRRESRRLRRE